MSGTRSISRPAPATDAPAAGTGLLLCAHGSAGSGETLALRAAALGARGGFADAAGALLYGRPRLEEIAPSLLGKRVRVVPLFLSAGHTFSALKARLADLPQPRRFQLCAPLGSHRGLAPGLLEATCAAAGRRGWPEPGLALVLAAHGSRRGPASRLATEDLARQIERSGRLGRVACAFLEEPPALDAVLAGIPEKRIVVAGCFAEQGQHACKDVPELIARSGRQALYLGPIAAAPWSDALILDSAGQAAHGAVTPSAAFEEQGPWHSPS